MSTHKFAIVTRLGVFLLPWMLVSVFHVSPAWSGGCPAAEGTCEPVLFADGLESQDLSRWAPLSTLSDDFEDGTLDGWQQLNPSDAMVEIVNGQLRIEPFQSLWFNNSSAILVSREISGNFMATATVRARGVANPDEPPPDLVRLGGLMARNPDTTDGENYVFLVVGRDVNDVSVEWKTTVDSCSTFNGPSWPSGDAELRLCRVGCTFHLYAREIGTTTWQLQNTIDRPDLPGRLQVGALAYANGFPPDVAITYESIDLERVETIEDCTGDLTAARSQD